MIIKNYIKHNIYPNQQYKENLDYEEAKRIVKEENSISCLILKPNINTNIIDYEIIECDDKICIDRSTIVFENIIKYIQMFQIKIEKITYLFHYKDNACGRDDFKYKLLASSRKINCNNIILFPTVFICKSQILKSSYYHHDATYIQNCDFTDIEWENKKPIFFFRGINSNNPFKIIKYNWNLERSSRSELFFEYLKLPEQYKKLCNISFDRIYPNKQILEDFINGAGTHKIFI
jgi:hypothetical protein